jgi:hypothetical protein
MTPDIKMSIWNRGPEFLDTVKGLDLAEEDDVFLLDHNKSHGDTKDRMHAAARELQRSKDTPPQCLLWYLPKRNLSLLHQLTCLAKCQQHF